MRCCVALLLWVLAPFATVAHVGSPNVFFEGTAGPYSIRATVRPPSVIPGLADLSIRVLTNGVDTVTVVPIRWNTGRAGAPSPDLAQPVAGESNLYHAELWFMQDGAQSVEIALSGSAGPGTVTVPVNAVASRVLNMPRHLGLVLALLGGTLYLALVCLIGATVRESTLAPGTTPSPGRLAASRWAMVIAAFALLNAGWFGLRWWEAEAGAYRNNRLFRPREASADIDLTTDPATLRLALSEEQFRRSGPLVPDHGKLVHLFLVRAPAMDVFAHLHPTKQDWRTFRGPLPALPPGRYDVYGDLTYETGFSETVTSQIEISSARPTDLDHSALDLDDAWWVDPHSSAARAPADSARIASSNIAIDLVSPGAWVAQKDVQLLFHLRAAPGQSLFLQPYMGMPGHLILRHQAGTVFTHLHPNGSFSMAAQSLFNLRAEGKAPLKVADPTADPLCQLPAPSSSAPIESSETVFSFPYAFPQPGAYRLWLQCRTSDGIVTRSFQVDVTSPAPK